MIVKINTKTGVRTDASKDKRKLKKDEVSFDTTTHIWDPYGKRVASKGVQKSGEIAELKRQVKFLAQKLNVTLPD